jgi:hypothetical protein
LLGHDETAMSAHDETAMLLAECAYAPFADFAFICLRCELMCFENAPNLCFTNQPMLVVATSIQ